MIVFRYLSREVLLTLSAVSAVLLVIIMSGRFIKYLAQAAQGLLDPGVLLLIISFRIPGFLQLILDPDDAGVAAAQQIRLALAGDFAR